MSGIILGPGLIGEAASKKAQQTAVDDTGGGAIQLGPGIASNKKFGKARELAVAAPAPAVPVALPHATPIAPLATPVHGLSEDDIEVMLARDANSWDIVAEAEALRTEGWRPRVAKMLLLAAPDAKQKPMAQEIQDHLVRIAQVGIEADAQKLAQAVDAAPEIGTGDPEAPSAPKTSRRTNR